MTVEEQSLWMFDRAYGATVCGLDEAGRGPLAGPVYAACVCLRPDAQIPHLNDSKKMTPARRERAFQAIVDGGAWYGVASASHEEIDEYNILKATFLAMNRACRAMLDTMDAPPELALVDGNRDPGLPLPTRLIVGGDALSASIAAASVLAKVSRDRVMEELDARYPQYAFAKHKGYPTALHYERLREYGPSPVHRRSFLKKFFDSRQPAPEPPANRTGVFGERYTEGWLTRQGYDVVARNWRGAHGEVDLIARQGDLVAFVEVKTRDRGFLASPAEAIDPAKRGRIIQTAREYLAQAGGNLQPRFDAALVVTQTQEGMTSVHSFEYIAGAFDGGGRP